MKRLLLGIAATVAAFGVVSVISAPAEGSHLITGKYGCDDNIDQDLDGRIDYDGGPKGGAPDPDCFGPTDDSESKPIGCALCVSFVTTWDGDRGGPAPARTRMHDGIVPNIPYALDVNGNLPPLALGVATPAVGYEIKVSVAALNPAKPTLKIDRLGSTTSSLPLRIELVDGDFGVSTTIGYDTLDSTAPKGFVAGLDLSDRDLNPLTDQARIDLTIDTPGPSLTVVNEQFSGYPAGPRSNRRVRRLTFRGTAATGTQVPTRASLDLTSRGEDQTVTVTRNQPTVLDFTLDEPGSGTDASGTVNKLPSSATVALSSPDLNGDGKDDQAIDYEGTEVVGTVKVQVHSPPTATSTTDSTTDATITDLPTEAGFTLASKTTGPEADPSSTTNATYYSNGIATRVDLTNTDVDPIKGTKVFKAAIDDLPETIDNLTYFGGPDESTLDYVASGIAGHAHVETKHGDERFSADVDDLPATVGMHLESPKSGTQFEYDADSVVPHAEVHTEGTIKGVPDPDPDPEPDHFREMDIVVDNLDQAGRGLPEHLEFRMDNDESTVSYFAPGGIPQIHVSGSDEEPFFARANELDLLLGEMPDAVDAALVPEFITLDAHGDQIGSMELLANSFGDRTRLPSTEDGILVHDRQDAYTLFGRLRGLRSARYVNHGPHAKTIEVDATPPAGTDAHVEIVSEVERDLWTSTVNGEAVPQVRKGVDDLDILLADYPSGIDLELDGSTDTKFIDYTADSAAGRFDMIREVRYGGAPVPVNYEQPYTNEHLNTEFPVANFTDFATGAMTPMPQEFHLCQDAKTDQCSGDTWERDMFEDFNPATEANGGSIRFQATPKTRLVLNDYDGGAVIPISYMRDRQEVEDAGQECEIPSAYVIPGSAPPAIRAGCIYTDTKPGILDKNIDLTFRDLVIQSHLESSGWVGHNIADLFASGDNQGYVAMDTGWQPTGLTGEELCFALGLEDPSPCGPGGEWEGEMGFFPPPPDESVSGTIAKGGDYCLSGEPKCEDEEIAESFPLGFAGKVDSLSLGFGNLFGADHRVFEFDPDELVFAIHQSGMAWCDDSTALDAGPSEITDYICSGMIRLDAPEE